jgi:type IV secretion system protein VirB8
MQANNPSSPLAFMPAGGSIKTEIASVSSLGANRALVRFLTTRADPGAQSLPPERWAAIIDYTFSNAAMTESDRLLNPLGFQVTRYRRDAETLTPSVESPVIPADAGITP